MAAALKNPSLVRSLTLHEPALLSVLAAESEEGKAAREDRKKFVGPVVAAAAKVIEANLDTEANRRLVTDYLATLDNEAKH